MSWLKDRFEIILRCICMLRIASGNFKDYFTRDI